MENLLKRTNLPVIFLVLALIVSAGACNNGADNEDDKAAAENTPVVTDTLGHKMERVVEKRYDDGKIRTLHYYRDSNNYFVRKLWPDGEDYIRGWIENGEREGDWFSWYKNGVLWSSGKYENGLRQGKSKSYFEDGSVRQVQEYKNDKPHGTWVFFDEQGNRIIEVDYDEGEKLAERRFDK
ncbi:MAG: toxin-antitoxin system YwqK family antitoxin [Bacteroidota bacterium]